MEKKISLFINNIIFLDTIDCYPSNILNENYIVKGRN